MTNETNLLGIKDRRSESGNVLFLILIAVVLFAALSYAVTQSTRSGGGDASSETNLVNSAQITQYPASIKTAITRMNVSLSISPDLLEFNTPATLAALTDPTYGVFHPSGGGGTYAQAPNDVMVSAGTNPTGIWKFNSENEVHNIGTSAGAATSTVGTADVIAFLPDIKKAICDKINSELGISGTTVETATIDVATLMINSNAGIGGGGGSIGFTGGATGLAGQPQGCYRAGAAGMYVYYAVLVER